MSKLNAIVVALALGGTVAAVYGAQVGDQWVVASAENKQLQCAGPQPNEPGTRNDPCGAQAGGKPAGGTVQSAGPHPDEPGISGDPISADKPYNKATGGPVTITPGPDADRNPNPVRKQ